MASSAQRRLAAPDIAAMIVDYGSGTDISDTDGGETDPNAIDSIESSSSSEDEYLEKLIAEKKYWPEEMVRNGEEWQTACCRNDVQARRDV